jgi:bacterioferritin
MPSERPRNNVAARNPARSWTVRFEDFPETIGMGQFVSDVQKIRERAREHMEQGAVTAGYRADAKRVIEVLNQALATELVCVLRYRRHYFAAKGINSESVKAEFLEHANEEQEHADRIAERISQLGGDPDFNPDGLLGRSHSEYVEGTDLVSMIKEDLVAERIAIESYSEIIRWLGADDPTTRKLMEEILEKEEEHANDMADLLARIAPH